MQAADQHLFISSCAGWATQGGVQTSGRLLAEQCMLGPLSADSAAAVAAEAALLPQPDVTLLALIGDSRPSESTLPPSKQLICACDMVQSSAGILSDFHLLHQNKLHRFYLPSPLGLGLIERCSGF
jgi:hypothetical protein